MYLKSNCNMEKENPAFYAIIPADVRYDKNLPNGAKLLYGEITALSNKLGHCYASNKYFSEHYQISERTVRDWLEALESRGYIRKEMHTKDFKTERWIFLVQGPKIIVKNKITKEIPKEIKKFYK